MSVARILAEFFVATSFEELPPLAVERAKIAIANTLASAGAGFDCTSARIARSLAKERGGASEATIWFETGLKTYVSEAARVNAMESDAAAYDESHMKCGAHIGTATVAAAIAMGERVDATGRDVLCAIVEGYEAGGRIGRIISTGLRKRGFHTCIISTFGATVAASKLLGLTEKEMAHAIALDATSIGGLHISTGGLTREYHAGQSAMLGVNAALAAQKGYPANENLLEARRGFFESFGGRVDVASLTEDLGKEWDIVTDMSLKLMPGAHTIHALVEAAITAAKAGNVTPGQVEHITVHGHRGWKNAMHVLHPTDFPGAIHSLPYNMAAAVADRDFTWRHASLEKINDPTIGLLQEKVRLKAVPRQHAAALYGGTVTITTKAGKEYSGTVEWPKGSPPRGIRWADVDAKYRALLPDTRLPLKKIEQSLQFIHELDRLETVSVLTALLHR